MGYHTYFSGSFTVTPTLKPEHIAYLTAFSVGRRMARNAAITETFPDPIREAAGLPIGPEGAYYVGAAAENWGQNNTPDILDHNRAPEGQPGLWCQWVPTEDGTEIVWDEGEKFYHYVDWIDYLIEHFLKPWCYELNGSVTWDGENSDDKGKIKIQGNQVRELVAHIVYGDEDE